MCTRFLRSPMMMFSSTYTQTHTQHTFACMDFYTFLWRFSSSSLVFFCMLRCCVMFILLVLVYTHFSGVRLRAKCAYVSVCVNMRAACALRPGPADSKWLRAPRSAQTKRHTTGLHEFEAPHHQQCVCVFLFVYGKMIDDHFYFVWICLCLLLGSSSSSSLVVVVG